jgi:hypothetical protein
MWVAASDPKSDFSIVVFPQPFRPTTPITSPGLQRKNTP